MTGRPGYRTMEMIGGSSAPYLARTPCVPLFCTLFNRVGNKERFRLPGAGGGSFPLYGGPFARSYSVSKNVSKINVSRPHVAQVKRNQCQRAHSTFGRDQYLTASASPLKICLKGQSFSARLLSLQSLSGVVGSPLLSLSSSRFVP